MITAISSATPTPSGQGRTPSGVTRWVGRSVSRAARSAGAGRSGESGAGRALAAQRPPDRLEQLRSRGEQEGVHGTGRHGRKVSASARGDEHAKRRAPGAVPGRAARNGSAGPIGEGGTRGRGDDQRGPDISLSAGRPPGGPRGAGRAGEPRDRAGHGPGRRAGAVRADRRGARARLPVGAARAGRCTPSRGCGCTCAIDERSAAFLALGPGPALRAARRGDLHLRHGGGQLPPGGDRGARVGRAAAACSPPTGRRSCAAPAPTRRSTRSSCTARRCAGSPRSGCPRSGPARWPTGGRWPAAPTSGRSGPADPGPVHLNLAFREPLIPDGDTTWCEPLDGDADRAVGARPGRAAARRAAHPADPARRARGRRRRGRTCAGTSPRPGMAGWPVLSEPQRRRPVRRPRHLHLPLPARHAGVRRRPPARRGGHARAVPGCRGRCCRGCSGPRSTSWSRPTWPAGPTRPARPPRSPRRWRSRWPRATTAGCTPGGGPTRRPGRRSTRCSTLRARASPGWPATWPTRCPTGRCCSAAPRCRSATWTRRCGPGAGCGCWPTGAPRASTAWCPRPWARRWRTTGPPTR